MDSASITGTTSVLTKIERTSPFQEARPERTSETKSPGERNLPGLEARSIDVFRQELRSSLRAKFDSYYPAPRPVYGGTQSPASADDVANEALATAKEITNATPQARAAKSVITFRSVVRESAEVVRNTLGERGDAAELDETVGKIDNGLNELETDIANTREATTSVLAIDSRSRENTRIRIRTQEGDIVSFNLRQVDRMKASDAAYSDGEMSASSTAVEMSSRSRMRLSVEGNLNDNELAAIQNVFAQAESMAESFYGGDLAAAFNQAQGFEFDNAELARVKVRFRSSQVSNVAYIESARPVDTNPQPAVPGSVQAPVGQPTPAAPSPSEPVPAAVAAPAPPVAAQTESVAAESNAATAVEATTDPAIADDAIAGFFQMITNFSRSVSESFEISGDGSSFRYQYAESFKLELLKTVFTAAAPAGSEPAAKTALQLIDVLNGDANASDV